MKATGHNQISWVFRSIGVVLLVLFTSQATLAETELFKSKIISDAESTELLEIELKEGEFEIKSDHGLLSALLCCSVHSSLVDLEIQSSTQGDFNTPTVYFLENRPIYLMFHSLKLCDPLSHS